MSVNDNIIKKYLEEHLSITIDTEYGGGIYVELLLDGQKISSDYAYLKDNYVTAD
jgi:hypothetical protein